MNKTTQSGDPVIQTCVFNINYIVSLWTSTTGVYETQFAILYNITLYIFISELHEYLT